MTSTLSAKEQPLSKIFSDDYVFSIPGYQRPYSWGTDQAQELLDDLIDYMQAGGTKLDEVAPYFLGSIVLIKRESSSEATVVDGQQRLTTLTLLLSAIRASVSSAGMQAGITKRIYEHGDVVTATAARYRLSLRERDREFFREYVQHEDGISRLVALTQTLPDAQQRLQRNAALFLSELAKLDEATLVRLVQFIATRCYLVTVATPDLDAAYRIFGVLNSRGLDLSATDILKAEIIGAIDKGRRDAYTEKWEGLEEDLGRDAFGDLFSHIRMVFRKAKPKGTLLKEFREHVDLRDPAAFIDQTLMPLALAFREIVDADFSSQRHAEAINRQLGWLNRLEFKDWLPPALAYFARHRNDPDAVLQFFSDLERLAYSMLVRRSGVNERIERFSRLTGTIEAAGDLYSSESPLQLTSKEQYATYDALSGPLYDTHSARALALILLRLDGLVSGGGAIYEHDIVTVEHVLPQNPKSGSNWVDWLPSPQDRLLWVHRLGNLALLTRKKNSAANNYDFDRKKSAYFTKQGVSPFALTTQVLQHAKWTKTVLEARQVLLLEVLEDHWRLNERQAPRAVAMQQAMTSEGRAPEFILVSEKHEIHAFATESGDEFMVLAGSLARSDWTGLDHSFQTLRQTLTDGGALVAGEGGKLTFARDVAFSSPSAASAVILGRPDNGRLSWKRAETGEPYGQWKTGSVERDDDAPDDENEDASPRGIILRRYWEQLIERSRATTTLFSGRKASTDHWLSAGIGRTGFNLMVSHRKGSSRVGLYLHLPNDPDGARTKAAYEGLFAQKIALEAAMGQPLEWQPLPTKTGKRICINIPGGWDWPESQWPELQDRMIQLSVRLADVMRAPVAALQV